MIIYADDEILYTALTRRVQSDNCRVTRKFTANADIAVAGNTKFNLVHNAEMLLINSEKLPEIGGFGSVRRLVSCGMSEKDTLNFSSIDGERAVLCVQRDVICGAARLENGEYPVEYDRNLSIYNNIALSICKIFAAL